MIEILSSNSSRFPAGTNCGLKTDMWGDPKTFFVMVKIFKHENIEFKSITVEILNEESSKSFFGSAGVGLIGAAALGPLGLVAGALAGGNKKSGVFGITFKQNEEEIKLVLKTNSKKEINFLRDQSFKKIA